MAGHESFEIPLVVRLDRSLTEDVSDNLAGTREIVRTTLLQVEPASYLEATLEQGLVHVGTEDEIEERLATLDAIPAEDAATILLDSRFRYGDWVSRGNILKLVGREKAQSALGGFAAGIFFAGGGAAVIEGLRQSSPNWFFGGLIVSIASGALTFGHRDLHISTMYDKQPLESELAALEKAVEERQLFALVRNKLRLRTRQQEEAASTEAI